jgi:hypothetical protein
MKKGFTMPTVKKIKAVLRTRSKTFLINLIMVMFSKMTKTAKISFLMKIDKRQVKRKARKVKRRTTKTGMRRKTARRAYKPKRKTTGRKKARSPAQKRNDKRLGKMAKARAKKRR